MRATILISFLLVASSLALNYESSVTFNLTIDSMTTIEDYLVGSGELNNGSASIFLFNNVSPFAILDTAILQETSAGSPTTIVSVSSSLAIVALANNGIVGEETFFYAVKVSGNNLQISQPYEAAYEDVIIGLVSQNIANDAVYFTFEPVDGPTNGNASLAKFDLSNNQVETVLSSISSLTGYKNINNLIMLPDNQNVVFLLIDNLYVRSFLKYNYETNTASPNSLNLDGVFYASLLQDGSSHGVTLSQSTSVTSNLTVQIVDYTSMLFISEELVLPISSCASVGLPIAINDNSIFITGNTEVNGASIFTINQIAYNANGDIKLVNSLTHSAIDCSAVTSMVANDDYLFIYTGYSVYKFQL